MLLDVTQVYCVLGGAQGRFGLNRSPNDGGQRVGAGVWTIARVGPTDALPLRSTVKGLSQEGHLAWP